MKKVLSILLAFTMMLSVFSLTSFAAFRPATAVQKTIVSEVKVDNNFSLSFKQLFRQMSNNFFNFLRLEKLIKVTDVTISEKQVSVDENGKREISVKVTPSNAANRSLTWKSTNEAVATAYGTNSGKGVIVGHRAGTAEIFAIAEDGGFYDKCTVTVIKDSVPCTGLSLSEYSVSVLTGSEHTVTATPTPSNTTDKIVVSNSNPSVVSAYLGQSNKIMLSGKSEGTATVAVTCGNITKKIAVTVTETIPCTSLSISQSEVALYTGYSQLITVTPTPSDTTDKVVMVNSNANVVSAYLDSSDRLQLSGKSGGFATITVTCGNVVRKISVEVIECDITWNYDKNSKTLTVSGSGEIPEFGYGKYPWESVMSEVKSIVVKEGITRIGKYAFNSSTTSLENISIPSTCKSLGYSFLGNCNIERLELPEGVEKLDENALYFANNINTIYIPSTLTEIYSKKSVDAMLSYEVSENNPKYSSEDGVMFNKNKTVLFAFPQKYENTTYTVPDSVETIGFRAMYGVDNVEVLNISGNVRNFEELCFCNASNLKEIHFGKTTCSTGIGNTVGLGQISSLHAKKSFIITVDEGNAYFNTDDNRSLYSKDFSTLYALCIKYISEEFKEYSFNENLTTFGIDSLTYNGNGLTSIGKMNENCVFNSVLCKATIPTSSKESFYQYRSTSSYGMTTALDFYIDGSAENDKNHVSDTTIMTDTPLSGTDNAVITFGGCTSSSYDGDVYFTLNSLRCSFSVPAGTVINTEQLNELFYFTSDTGASLSKYFVLTCPVVEFEAEAQSHYIIPIADKPLSSPFCNTREIVIDIEGKDVEPFTVYFDSSELNISNIAGANRNNLYPYIFAALKSQAFFKNYSYSEDLMNRIVDSINIVPGSSLGPLSNSVEVLVIAPAQPDPVVKITYYKDGVVGTTDYPAFSVSPGTALTAEYIANVMLSDESLGITDVTMDSGDFTDSAESGKTYNFIVTCG